MKTLLILALALTGCAVSVDVPRPPPADAGADAAEPAEAVTFTAPEAGELAPFHPVYCELADGGIGLCADGAP